MLEVTLLIIFLLLFGWLSWHNLQRGLFLVIVLLPVYLVRFHLGPVPVTLLESMIWILFINWFLKSLLHIHLWPRSKFIGAALVILFISFLAIFVSSDLRAAAGLWKAYFLAPFLFLVVFSGLVKKSEHIREVILALGISALLVSIMAIIQKLAGGYLVPTAYWLLGEGERVTSFYPYPNAVGLFLAPIVILYVGLVVSRWWLVANKKGWSLFFSMSVIITGVLAIILAKSDGALVGLVAGLAVLGLFFKKSRWWVAGLAILGGVAFLANLVPQSIVDTLLFRDWSGKIRLLMWRETWQLIRDHWFLGVGLAGYQTALASYHQAKEIEIFMYPHNFIFNFWVELGLAGLLTFLYIIGKFFRLGVAVLKSKACPEPFGFAQGWLRREVKNFRVVGAALLAALVVILVHGLVDVPYFKNDLAILWWTIFGLMSSLYNLKNV
ncbi:MAG: O-antigen ligase family protein [Patescibacteria group bacterium]